MGMGYYSGFGIISPLDSSKKATCLIFANLLHSINPVLGGTTKRTARYVCHPPTFVGDKWTGNWDIEIKMRLRFCESKIDYWANIYTEYQTPEGQERENQVIEFQDGIQERGHLIRYELYKVAEWVLSVYGESTADPTLENPDTLIQVTTRQAFTSTGDLEKLQSLTQSGLKGIGQTTASAVLHLYDNGQYPILSKRALWSVGERGRDYYPPWLWLRYIEFCRDIANRNGRDMRTLDRALWRYSYDSEER